MTDFGLAKREAGEITMTPDGQVLGTPAYMSPEQASGEGHQVDGRSDVYSLGVILYELLTGELPFRGTKRMLIYQVIHDEPRPPRRLNDRIPRDLDTICLKAMAKEPSRRYATAAELSADLRRWLRGEPIEARRVGRLERAWRWCRRNRTLAIATSLVAVAILTLGGVFLFYLEQKRIATQERRAREKAEQRVAREKWARENAEQQNKDLQHERERSNDPSAFARLLILQASQKDDRLLKALAGAMPGVLAQFQEALAALRTSLQFAQSLPQAEKDYAATQADPWASALLGECLLRASAKPTDESLERARSVLAGISAEANTTQGYAEWAKGLLALHSDSSS